MKDLTVREKRRCRRNFYRACILWSLGNSFAGTVPVLLLLHLQGLSWGSAALFAFTGPLVGNLFRITAPMFSGPQTDPRARTILLYAMQAMTLAGASMIFFPAEHTLLPLKWSIVLFLGFWYLSNIFENLAYVTALAWTGKLFSKQVLGRFYALRERWFLAGEVCVVVSVGMLLNMVREVCFQGTFPAEVLQYIYPSILLTGGLLTGASLCFLNRIASFPNTSLSPKEQPAVRNPALRALMKPLKDPTFRWMVLYGILFAFFTQLEQPTRSRFQNSILGGDGICFISLNSLLNIITRGGQIFFAAAAGKWVDRSGTLPVMMFSQLMTAFALLFYVGAAIFPQTLFLIGASVVWIAYVGSNVGFPKFFIENSDSGEVSRPAAYGFFGGLGGLAGSFCGKKLLDHFANVPHYYLWMFLLFFFIRLLLVLPLFAACRSAERIRKRSGQETEKT